MEGINDALQHFLPNWPLHTSINYNYHKPVSFLENQTRKLFPHTQNQFIAPITQIQCYLRYRELRRPNF